MQADAAKKRVMLFLHLGFFDSWVSAGLVKKLSNYSEIVLIIQSDDSNVELGAEVLSENEIHVIKFSHYSLFLAKAVQDVELIRRRQLSKSFRLRIKRRMFGEVRFDANCIPMRLRFIHFCKSVYQCGKFFTIGPHRIVAFVPILSFLLYKLLVLLFKSIKDSKVMGLLPQVDVVVIPTSGMENVFSIVNQARMTKTPTILVMENWDNMSSKSTITFEPDALTVMGETSVESGLRIQGLKRAKLYPIGVPRHNYLRNNKMLIESYKERKKSKYQVLYLGCAVPHNEINVINELFSGLKRSLLTTKIDIVYRPHPARQSRFYEATLRQEILQQRPSDSRTRAKLPVIDHTYSQSILEADLIIAAPTSMALEAMHLGKHVIIDGTDDGIHRTTSAELLQNSEHVQELKAIIGLKIAHTVEELFDEVVRIFNEGGTSPLDVSSLISSNDEHFSIVLNKIINDVIKH